VGSSLAVSLLSAAGGRPAGGRSNYQADRRRRKGEGAGALKTAGQPRRVHQRGVPRIASGRDFIAAQVLKHMAWTAPGCCCTRRARRSRTRRCCDCHWRALGDWSRRWCGGWRSGFITATDGRCAPTLAGNGAVAFERCGAGRPGARGPSAPRSRWLSGAWLQARGELCGAEFGQAIALASVVCGVEADGTTPAWPAAVARCGG